MVGNDVVDLVSRGPDSRRVSPGFDRRVFCDDERREIARSPDPDRMRWSLWAAKEAAYKAAKRIDGRVVWSPIRFRTCLGATPDEGSVQHDSGRYPVRFVPADNGVHALAVTESLAEALAAAGTRGAELSFGCRRAPVGDASAEVRQLTREELSARLGVSPDQLAVRKARRIPDLWCSGAPIAAPLSLSHHGELVAYACMIPAPRRSS